MVTVRNLCPLSLFSCSLFRVSRLITEKEPALVVPEFQILLVSFSARVVPIYVAECAHQLGSPNQLMEVTYGFGVSRLFCCSGVLGHQNLREPCHRGALIYFGSLLWLFQLIEELVRLRIKDGYATRPL